MSPQSPLASAVRKPTAAAPLQQGDVVVEVVEVVVVEVVDTRVVLVDEVVDVVVLRDVEDVLLVDVVVLEDVVEVIGTPQDVGGGASVR
jgi:hypothetical protein